MKFFWLFFGSLAVLSQINAVYVQEVQMAQTHDISNSCTNQKNWALFPNPHDCHKFIVCANHVPEEFTCESNYYFDVEAKYCVRGTCDEIKECQSSIRATKDNCQAFEICDGKGKYVRHNCVGNTYFNGKLGICLPIEHTPDHMCSCILPQYAILESSTNCETYYMCVNGRAIEQQCPRGNYFDRRLKSCILDMQGVCVSSSNAIIAMSPEESAMLETCERLRLRDTTTATTAIDKVIFVPDSMDCQKFYMCVNGRVVGKVCPIGFYYDRETKYCVYDTNDEKCEGMREEAKRFKEQQEKEAAESLEMEHASNSQQNHKAAGEEQSKPPVHPALSYTHLKVEADKGNKIEAATAAVAAEPQSAAIKPQRSVEMMHTADLLNSIHHQQPAVLLVQPSKIQLENSEIQQASKKENENEKETKNQINLIKVDLNDKLHLTEKINAEFKEPLKKPAYNKLSSKFMSF